MLYSFVTSKCLTRSLIGAFLSNPFCTNGIAGDRSSPSRRCERCSLYLYLRKAPQISKIRAPASFLEELVDSGSPFSTPSVTASARTTRPRRNAIPDSPSSVGDQDTFSTSNLDRVPQRHVFREPGVTVFLFAMSAGRSPRSSEDVSEERSIALKSRLQGSGTVRKSTDPARLWRMWLGCFNHA